MGYGSLKCAARHIITMRIASWKFRFQQDSEGLYSASCSHTNSRLHSPTDTIEYLSWLVHTRPINIAYHFSISSAYRLPTLHLVSHSVSCKTNLPKVTSGLFRRSVRFFTVLQIKRFSAVIATWGCSQHYKRSAAESSLTVYLEY